MRLLYTPPPSRFSSSTWQCYDCEKETADSFHLVWHFGPHIESWVRALIILELELLEMEQSIENRGVSLLPLERASQCST